MFSIMHSQLVVLFVLAMMAGGTSANPKSDAAQIVLNIVDNPNVYNKNILPYQNRSGPLEVKSLVYIRNMNVDDINMRLIVDLTFRMYWQDHRLSYSVAGVPSVRFSDVSKFWVPDAFFRDSSSTEQMKSIHPESFIQVTNKGSLLYSTRLSLNLACPMDLTRFPHDVSTCTIKFASYGHTRKDIVFSMLKAADAETKFNEPHVSILTNRFTVSDIREDGTCNSQTATGDYSCLMISIDINRRFVAYLMEWYIPCMCFVIVAFLSELLKADLLLPRLAMTVGPLLTLAATSISYAQKFPTVPYITAYSLFTGTSLIAIFATVIHVIVGYYYHLKPTEEVKKDVEGETTKLKAIRAKLRAHSDVITKGLIVGIYSAFVFLYMLAYCL